MSRRRWRRWRRRRRDRRLARTGDNISRAREVCTRREARRTGRESRTRRRRIPASCTPWRRAPRSELCVRGARRRGRGMVSRVRGGGIRGTRACGGSPRGDGSPGARRERATARQIQSRPWLGESRVTEDAPSVGLERAVAQAQHGRTRGGGRGCATQRPGRVRRAEREGDDHHRPQHRVWASWSGCS